MYCTPSYIIIKLLNKYLRAVVGYLNYITVHVLPCYLGLKGIQYAKNVTYDSKYSNKHCIGTETKKLFPLPIWGLHVHIYMAAIFKI